MSKQYEPFDIEWEKEISKLPKKILVKMIRYIQQTNNKQDEKLKELLKDCRRVMCNDCGTPACKVCFKDELKKKINEVLKW